MKDTGKAVLNTLGGLAVFTVSGFFVVLILLGVLIVGGVAILGLSAANPRLGLVVLAIVAAVIAWPIVTWLALPLLAAASALGGLKPASGVPDLRWPQFATYEGACDYWSERNCEDACTPRKWDPAERREVERQLARFREARRDRERQERCQAREQRRRR